MIKRSIQSLASTWLAGLLVLLPLALTAAVLALGLRPDQPVRRTRQLCRRDLRGVGVPVLQQPGLAYVFGTLVLIVAIYLLGLIVQSGLTGPLKRLTDRTSGVSRSSERCTTSPIGSSGCWIRSRKPTSAP